MSAPNLSIVEKMPPSCGDISAMLRKLADEIDSGEHSFLTAITAVMDYEDCDLRVMLWGRMAGAYDAIGALEVGKAHLIQARLKACPE